MPAFVHLPPSPLLGIGNWFSLNNFGVSPKVLKDLGSTLGGDNGEAHRFNMIHSCQYLLNI